MTNAKNIAHHTPHVIAVRLALEALDPRPARWVICRHDEAASYPGWTIVSQHGDFVGLIEPARTDGASAPASPSGAPPPK